ncbi:MAG: hypothetical protein Q9217_004448 [Psora testacea]
MPLVKSPSVSGSSTSRQSISRDREPQRNAAGAFYCDHADCAHDPPIFARKCEWRQVLPLENLQEHLRRVHRDVDPEAKQVPAPMSSDQQGTTTGSQTQEGTRKRRRRATEAEDSDDNEDESPQGLKQQVKKLRRELQEKDERLKKLEERFEELAHRRQL